MTAVLTVLLSASSSAQPAGTERGEAATRLFVYSDNDATEVITSVVAAEGAVTDKVRLGASALVDVISSASVDVVSAATERWEETRVEVAAQVEVTLPRAGMSLSYRRSQENDWLSHTVFAGVSTELFQKNTRLSAVYGLTTNTVGRASDPNFSRDLDSHSGELAIGQLIDRNTRIGAAYTLQRLAGFMSSPYRYVVALDGTRVPERHPGSRIRQALSGFVVRALTESIVGRASYRVYFDDWGLTSHTVSARLAVAVMPWLIAGLEARAYRQNRADFYQGVYDTSYRYMTFDRELSSFWDAGGTTDITASFGPVTADVKLGAIYYKFDDFPALPNRTAFIASGGAKVVWQ